MELSARHHHQVNAPKRGGRLTLYEKRCKARNLHSKKGFQRRVRQLERKSVYFFPKIMVVGTILLLGCKIKKSNFSVIACASTAGTGASRFFTAKQSPRWLEDCFGEKTPPRSDTIKYVCNTATKVVTTLVCGTIDWSKRLIELDWRKPYNISMHLSSASLPGSRSAGE